MFHFNNGQVIVNDDTGGSVAGSERMLFDGDCSIIEKGSDRSYGIDGSLYGEYASRK